MTHASEGGTHWYSRTGEPVYEVPSADGKKMVSPTIVHARKLGLCPGFTAVNKVLYSYGLERYKIRQAILAALTLPRIPGESDEAYFARLDEDRQAHAKGRADEGTQIHKAVEQCIRGETYDLKWNVQVTAVMDLFKSLPHSFIGDLKSKETLAGKEDRELFFDDHVMQLAAYARGIYSGVSPTAIPFARLVPEVTFAHRMGYGGRVDVLRVAEPGSQMPLVSIIVSVKEPGLVKFKIWNDEEVKRGLALFDASLAIWKLRNRFDSGWE